MKPKPDLIIHNIGQLLTMDPNIGNNEQNELKGLGLIPHGALAVCGERIIWVGPECDLKQAVNTTRVKKIDTHGRTVMPGLIDCHTHCIFAGSRAWEFVQRIQNVSYEKILSKGGGIHSTVRATRNASEEALVWLGLKRLDLFLTLGVTTIEVKSGYGLDTRSEVKMLRVARELNNQHYVDIVPTFLGAHVIPEEFRENRARYVDKLISEMIPEVAEQRLARFCDVFCDANAFSLTETAKILEAGRKYGLIPKIHGEQLSHLGSVKLAVELDAASIDHLERATKEDAKLLANSNTVAVLLPGATYFLGKKKFANGQMLADSGCKVAIATDFNPGTCNSENLPLMLNMACLYNHVSPREALLGATRYAACALRADANIGSIAPGKLADILVLDTSDWREFIYHFGFLHTYLVFKRGKLVWNSTPKIPKLHSL